MATINEIKNLIKTKIEGQGSQVDIGNGLPSVLNGVADLIQQVQESIGKGYIFVGCFKEEDLPEFPETDTNHYSAFVWREDEGYFSFMLWEKTNGWDEFSTYFDFRAIITLADLKAYKDSTRPNSYITPKCLVDYCKDFIAIPSLEIDGTKKEGDTESLGFNVEAVPAVKINGAVYYANPVMTDALIAEVIGDSQLSGVYKVFGQINYNDDNTVEGTFWLYGYSVTLFPTKNTGFVEVTIQQFPWGN